MSIGLVVDVSDLNNMAERLQEMGARIPTAIEGALDVIAEERKRYIEEEAPEGKEQDDRYGPDYDIQLKDSFSVQRRQGARVITTDTPRKFLWVTQGTKPPTSGTGFIFPRLQEALYWPGLGHPIEFVGRPRTKQHPGNTHPNNFVERAMQKWEAAGGDAHIVVEIVDTIVITPMPIGKRGGVKRPRAGGFGLGGIG